MQRHHLRTLAALYAHPLQHGVRVSKVEALLRALGAEVSELDGRRLKIVMPGGQETWIRLGCGIQSPDLDSEAMLRVRHLLQEAGVTAEHPEPEAASPRGDQSHRLVLHLDHHHTDVLQLEGDGVEHAVLKPHGGWAGHESLTHRHDRDEAGQRAPIDTEYLAQIVAAMAAADGVLLLGHGSGESDMRLVLLDYLQQHRPDLLDRIVGIDSLSMAHPSEAQILANAREHFGNFAHRRPVLAPGQEYKPLGPLA